MPRCFPREAWQQPTDVHIHYVDNTARRGEDDRGPLAAGVSVQKTSCGLRCGEAQGRPAHVEKSQLVMGGVLCLAIGLISGGVLFSQSQPRSVLAIHHCQPCLNVHELAGLLASVGIQKFPGLLPSVVFETDRTLAMQVPSTKPGVHYVIIPKKDINNIGDISAEDAPYLIDIFAVVQYLV